MSKTLIKKELKVALSDCLPVTYVTHNGIMFQSSYNDQTKVVSDSMLVLLFLLLHQFSLTSTNTQQEKHAGLTALLLNKTAD